MYQSDPWLSRVYREFEAGNLTPCWRDVLKALGRFKGSRFGLFPSHALLAARARCSVRTVQRALEAARDLGLVDWAERRIRAGWRFLRTSNRYFLRIPPGQVQLGPHGPATTGQKGRGAPQERKQEAHERSPGGLAAMLEGARRLPDLLAARQAAWNAGQVRPAK